MTVEASDAQLLAALPAGDWEANGVPGPALRADREQAAELVATALAGHLRPEGLRASVLGPGWSRDLDAHVRDLPEPAVLQDLGWWCLDPLLARLGRPTRGRWAVLRDGRVIGALDLQLSEPPDPVRATVARCRARGEVRVREVLELRAHAGAGRELPEGDVLQAARRAERALGGGLLGGQGVVPAAPPVVLARTAAGRARSGAGVLAGRARHRRLTVAVTGVDGAGKSTLAAEVVEQLHRAGVPAGRVWARPGMGLGPLERLARAAKRLTGASTAPGIRDAAAGRALDLRSRRGLLGVAWTLLVTLAFLRDARRQHRRVDGVVVYDRHLQDALATLAVAYPRAGNRAACWLVRRALPKAHLTFYLDVTAEEAARRKPGDTMGLLAVTAQLADYARTAGLVPGLHRLDACEPLELNARRVLERLVAP